jgi:LPXTG-motif cell wall-anchored protein
MLAFNAFGTKEIVVYVIAIIVVLALLGWYLMRRRTKA